MRISLVLDMFSKNKSGTKFLLDRRHVTYGLSKLLN